MDFPYYSFPMHPKLQLVKFSLLLFFCCALNKIYTNIFRLIEKFWANKVINIEQTIFVISKPNDFTVLIYRWHASESPYYMTMSGRPSLNMHQTFFIQRN